MAGLGHANNAFHDAVLQEGAASVASCNSRCRHPPWFQLRGRPSALSGNSRAHVSSFLGLGPRREAPLPRGLGNQACMESRHLMISGVLHRRISIEISDESGGGRGVRHSLDTAAGGGSRA